MNNTQKTDDAWQDAKEEGEEDGYTNWQIVALEMKRYAEGLELEMNRVAKEVEALSTESDKVKNAALDELETVTRSACNTRLVNRDYNGQVAGTMATDSGAISHQASALRMLAGAVPPRFRIVGGSGRMIVGYWPENDPLKQENKSP